MLLYVSLFFMSLTLSVEAYSMNAFWRALGYQVPYTRQEIVNAESRGYRDDLRSKMLGYNLELLRTSKAEGKNTQFNDSFLTDAKLTGFEGKKGNFSGSALRCARLNEGNFRKAKFKDADLEHADLSGGFFEQADFRNVQLNEATLRTADLRNSNLKNARLWRADLRGANLEGANLKGASLYDANLKGADLRGAYLEVARLHSARLEDVKRYDDPEQNRDWLTVMESQGARVDTYPGSLYDLESKSNLGYEPQGHQRRRGDYQAAIWKKYVQDNQSQVDRDEKPAPQAKPQSTGWWTRVWAKR